MGEGLFGPRSHPRRPVHLGLVGERADDAQRAAHVIGIVAIKRPRHRGPEIVELRALPLSPGELVTADKAEPGFLRPAGEVLGVATTPGIGVAVLVDAFPRILAQRLEHLIPSRAFAGLFGDDHRLRHQLRQRVEHIPRFDTISHHDRLRGCSVETPREDTETVEHRPLTLTEQRIRPIDRRLQRLMPFLRAPPPTREQPEPLIEQPSDLQRRHRHDPRRRELDRKRDPIETPTDLADRIRVRRIEHERRTRGLRTFHEQHRRVVRGRSRTDLRERERPQRPHMLAVHRERLPTCRQDPHSCALPQDPLGERTPPGPTAGHSYPRRATVPWCAGTR